MVADVGTIVTAAQGWLQSYVQIVTSNPLILMFVLVTFVGLGVGLLKRLIRL